MRLWRRACGMIKDQNNIWIASLSRRTSFRNPEIEAAVIKATSHDEFSMNMKNVDRVYKWLRLSPTHLKSLIWAIYIRMEKTRSWVVAIKGLMLMHGVYSSRLPDVQRIGRLPFDLSKFKDGHSNPSKMWWINVFIRAYFTYLDQKSSLLFMNLQESRNLQNLENLAMKERIYSMTQDLVLLQKLQYLLDMLLEIRPKSDSAIVPLVLEAMDCVMIEVFDIYIRICNVIARISIRIYSVGKIEAKMALKVVKKATLQGEELSLYFELCRTIGVKNAKQCPKVEQIPDEDIRELEENINGVYEKAYEMFDEMPQQENEAKAIVVQEIICEEKKFKTVITDRWETFDENFVVEEEENGANPFENSLISISAINGPGKPQELPDLVSFL